MATYEDPNLFPFVNWDDDDLFDSFLNPIGLSDNTDDVAMHMQEGNKGNNNGTTTYNFDYTHEGAQAEFGASCQTSPAVVPVSNLADMEVSPTEPVIPQFGAHHDDHAASSSQHLKHSWNYQPGRTLMDYSSSLPEQPTVAGGLDPEFLKSSNNFDTVQSHRNSLTVFMHEPQSSQFPIAASPALEKAAVKCQPALLELVQHHKRSAREKAIGSGHFIQRLRQGRPPAKRPRVKQQMNVVAQSKRVPCVACKYNHRTCSGRQPCDRCKAMLLLRSTLSQEKYLMHTSCFSFDFETHNAFIQECTDCSNLLGPLEEVRKGRTFALDWYECCRDMFTAFRDESLREHFSRIRRITVIAASERHAASHWWRSLDLKYPEGALHVLYTTYLLLDKPFVQKVLPAIDAGMIQALHAHASQRIFGFLKECLSRRKTWIAGAPTTFLPDISFWVAFGLLSLISTDRDRASCTVPDLPDVRSQEQYLEALIHIWGPRSSQRNKPFFTNFFARNLSAKKASLKDVKCYGYSRERLPALDGSTLSKRISGVSFACLESSPLVPPDYMRHLEISSEDVMCVLSCLGKIRFEGRRETDQFPKCAYRTRAAMVLMTRIVVKYLTETSARSEDLFGMRFLVAGSGASYPVTTSASIVAWAEDYMAAPGKRDLELRIAEVAKAVAYRAATHGVEFGVNPTHTSDDERMERLSSLVRCFIPFILLEGKIITREQALAAWISLYENPRFRCGMLYLMSDSGKFLSLALRYMCTDLPD